MADRAIKKNDTWPPLEAVLMDQNGPINLTTATSVKFLMRGTKRKNPFSTSGTCTVVDAPKGEVVFFWSPTNTSVADTYQGEFEISWADGSVGTVPNSGYLYVLVFDDLG